MPPFWLLPSFYPICVQIVYRHKNKILKQCCKLSYCVAFKFCVLYFQLPYYPCLRAVEGCLKNNIL